MSNNQLSDLERTVQASPRRDVTRFDKVYEQLVRRYYTLAERLGVPDGFCRPGTARERRGVAVLIHHVVTKNELRQTSALAVYPDGAEVRAGEVLRKLHPGIWAEHQAPRVSTQNGGLFADPLDYVFGSGTTDRRTWLMPQLCKALLPVVNVMREDHDLGWRLASADIQRRIHRALKCEFGSPYLISLTLEL